MLTPEEKNRYDRHLILSEIGLEGQEKLKNARILVIGAGGLGCPVLQYLTAAGIGTIGIVDFDNVDESNLQRQILFGIHDIGKNKAVAAKERLEQLNPHVQFDIYQYRLEASNALALFEQYDLIIDGTDNFSTRYLVNDACVVTGKPLVFGAIFKFEGQVSVFNYEKGPSYRCLFPSAPEAGSVPNCSEIGVLGVLPGMIGTQQANEALKIVLGIGNVLSGKIMNYNALNTQSYILNITRVDTEIQQVIDRKAHFSEYNYDFFCGLTTSEEITPNELRHLIQQGQHLQIIDVRQPHEQPKIKELGNINIPLNELTNRIQELDSQAKTIVYCQHGIRSVQASEILQEAGFKHVTNMTGGIVRW